MNSKAPHEQQSEIKALISKGLEQGYLTYAEINDHLPDDIVDPEQIEDIMAVLKGVGIEVHDAAPDADTVADGAAGSSSDDEAAAEEAVALLSAVDAEVGRTTDPVRMYMREMGTVELLTREGEIAIAKRIEEGLGQVQTALASFPLTIELLLEEYDQHLDGKRRLSEILAGFLDLEEAADSPRKEKEAAAAEAAANGEDESRRRRGRRRRHRGRGSRPDRSRSGRGQASHGAAARLLRQVPEGRPQGRQTSPTRRSSSCATRWPRSSSSSSCRPR